MLLSTAPISHDANIKAVVIKIGGSTLGKNDTTLEDVVTLQRYRAMPVVVHGGAQLVSRWLDRVGITTQFVRGLRVTDAQTLQIVTAVLAGLVNKQLVASIESLGGLAMGLSGVDGRLIEAVPRDDELGHTGDVIKINTKPLNVAIDAGYIPVIAPLSLQSSAGKNSSGALLNVNGDHAAGEIAAALGAEQLIFLTDVVGVCDESGALISHLSQGEARSLMAAGVASGGMIPKLEACLKALHAIPTARIVDGRVPHALLAEIEGKGKGTTIE